MTFCSFACCFSQGTDRMDKIEIFQILGIPETKDEKAIKNAYREKLAGANPEDDPEGFKRLRGAYEQACRLAKQCEKPSEEDTTPSGLWVQKAAGIYADLETRRDVACWESLFREDCFVSLEEEENCRRKLLVFLMDHFRLPTDVWKLLDKRLGITRDAASLREHFPGEFIHFLTNRCSRGEDVGFDQFEGERDAPYDLFLQYYDRCLLAFQENDLEKAGENIRLADGLGIRHPVMELCRAELLMRQERPEEALQLLERLHEKYPGDAMVSYSLAENLWKQPEGAGHNFRRRAAALYEQLKAENDAHYMANLRLMEWYFDQGQIHQAKECGEQILYVGGDASFMDLLLRVNEKIEQELQTQYEKTGDPGAALELCWCYLQDGRTAKGIDLAERLRHQVPPGKKEEYSGLMAKLYLEAAQYQEAAEMAGLWRGQLEQKLASGGSAEEERDKDRVRQAGLIRMQSFYFLGFQDGGQFAAALKECGRLLEQSPQDVGVLLQMAQIYMEMGEYGKCLEVTDQLVNSYQVYAAYSVSMEACRRQLLAGGVVTNALKCIQYFPGYGKAYEYLAKVYLDLKRPGELEKLLQDAEKNQVKSVLLDAYRYQMVKDFPEEDVGDLDIKLKQFRKEYLQPVERGQLSLYEKGLALINEYFYRFPDSCLLVERGLFHKAAHRYQEAREDFEKALALSPANPYAFHGLSQVYRAAGDYEKALVNLRKAILYADGEAKPYFSVGMARLYSLLGEYEKALLVLRECENLPKKGAPGLLAADLMADCYVNLGKPEDAWQVYGHFDKLPRYEICRKKAFSFLRCGCREQAQAALEEWRRAMEAARGSKWNRFVSRLRPGGVNAVWMDDCTYHNMAGWVELLTGSRQEALKEFRRSLPLSLAADLKNADLPLWILRDAVFAAILLSEEKLGIRWAKLLRLQTAREGKAPERFYGKERERLACELLSAFFLEPVDSLEKMLERESSCSGCINCDSPVCRELESVRILLLLREGHREEARERLMQALKLQPGEEYMQAIRRVAFETPPLRQNKRKHDSRN